MPHVSGLRWGDGIQGDSPCGEDIDLDPEFESLADEIGKDKSLHGVQKTDWVAVYELADSLLARSKNLWPFAYGIAAVYHVKSVHDCAESIESLIKLLSTHWHCLYPSLKRPKRRVAPLKWLCDKFRAIAETTAFLGVSPKEISALNDAFVRLQNKIDSLLPDNGLTFKSILRAQMGSGQESSSHPEQPSDAVATPKAAREAQPLRKTLEEIEKSAIIPSAALPQVIRTINENARQLGDHLLAINREDERAYLLHRTGLWGTLMQLPPSDASGLTQLTCPVPPAMIETFMAGVKDKRYSEMLPQIESVASKAPFWLDGQYLIVKCLEGLVATLPAFCVKHSLAQLVKRFPDILSLKFRDGSPFASPKTISWIDSFLPVLFGGDSFVAGNRDFFGDTVPADERSLLQDAIGLSLENGFTAGLTVLGTIPPGKSRAFLRHCLVKAKYCIAAGHPQPAAFILKSLVNKLKLWDLLDWEPDLTAEAVSLLLSVSSKKKEQDEELQSLLHAISLETAFSIARP